MSLKTTFIAAILFIAACTSLPMPGFLGGSSAHKTETETSTTTHEINGRPVAQREGDEAAPDKPAKHDKQSKKDKDFGKTCHHNSDCGADACYVGSGDLGYCTSFCNNFMDCPMHWGCKKPGNAPQRICMQDSE
jgi:hypothetical protein